MDYRKILKDANLRVTPQRITVLEAISQINNHPSADDISRIMQNNHPNIALGTIYNILDSFTSAGILTRVKTDKGSMLYDMVSDKHHHLYGSNSDRIEDYYDDDLDHLLEEYFNNKNIKGFDIEEIKVQVVGKFKK